jgi:hypothetical protein
MELAKELLHQMDIAQDSRDLSADEEWLRNNLKKHCLALASLPLTYYFSVEVEDWMDQGRGC